MKGRIATPDHLPESSDTVRHAKPLPHAQTVTFEGGFDLAMGGHLPSVTVAYETYGRLSPAKGNAVLICHAISGDSHVARHDDQDDAGWCDILVGRGKAIDTDRLFVVCPNLLGGCRGTTVPGSINPVTGRPYGRDFPTITIGDRPPVAIRQLILDYFAHMENHERQARQVIAG